MGPQRIVWIVSKDCMFAKSWNTLAIRATIASAQAWAVKI